RDKERVREVVRERGERGEGGRTLVSFGVVGFIVLNEQEELLRSALFEHTHKGGLEGFCVCCGHFVYFSALIHVTSFHRLKLQIPRNFRVNKHISQDTTRHNELWNQIYVKVTTRSKITRVRFAKIYLFIYLFIIKS